MDESPKEREMIKEKCEELMDTFQIKVDRDPSKS